MASQDPAPRRLLRPYQVEALRAIADAHRRGVRRQLLVLPVGAGKTVIAASIPAVMGDPRLIYCAHRLELLEQTLARFIEWRPDRPAGMERGDIHPAPLDLTVVATIQSLSRPDRLARYAPEDWPLMVCDEAHRSTAPSYVAVFRHFRHLPSDAHPARADGLLLGMTGTSRRTDNVGLGSVYEEVPFTRTLRDMIEDGYLVPLRGYLLRGGALLDQIRTRVEDGERDFDPDDLARAVNTPERNQLVVDGTRHIAVREGRPTLVFAANIAHGEALAALFQRAGIAAANIHGEMPLDRRRAILDAFSRGELQVLVNCQLLLEGIDIPRISAVVMARPTQSALLYSQAIGRGTRPAPGKGDCIIIDFVDNTTRHAQSLVTLPTLFGLPAGFDLKGAPAHHAARRLEDAAAAVAGGIDSGTASRIRSVDDIPRVFYEVDLLKIASLPPHLSRLTAFAWQRMPDGSMALIIPRPQRADGQRQATAPRDDAGILEIAENAIGHYEIRHRAGPGAPARLSEHPSVEAALRSADALVRQRWGDRAVLLNKTAAWRQEPATEKQLRLLESLGQPVPRDPSGAVRLTKGQATLLIDRALLLRQAKRAAAEAAPPEPATPEQIAYLLALERRRLVSIPRAPSGAIRLTKREARRLIGMAKAAQKSGKPARQPSAPR